MASRHGERSEHTSPGRSSYGQLAHRNFEVRQRSFHLKSTEEYLSDFLHNWQGKHFHWTHLKGVPNTKVKSPSDSIPWFTPVKKNGFNTDQYTPGLSRATTGQKPCTDAPDAGSFTHIISMKGKCFLWISPGHWVPRLKTLLGLSVRVFHMNELLNHERRRPPSPMWVVVLILWEPEENKRWRKAKFNLQPPPSCPQVPQSLWLSWKISFYLLLSDLRLG